MSSDHTPEVTDIELRKLAKALRVPVAVLLE